MQKCARVCVCVCIHQMGWEDWGEVWKQYGLRVYGFKRAWVGGLGLVGENVGFGVRFGL